MSFTNSPVFSMVSELLLLLKCSYIRVEWGENWKGGAESITYLAELLIDGFGDCVITVHTYWWIYETPWFDCGRWGSHFKFVSYI